ncbi:TIGR00730 family Rossman fold protein [Sphingomonas alba]|uniref:Cytokinin riboside 5'-monophosphate phosphoribohydrolase n=1 Tax=Sphingomonas alba TaxID=2908208 RepID=A0ABT0RI86_9SPHN|nr:TIGR00730 family Rossman fold protein [Sphingomonas alba]MCL6682297.1 TIGR00730 family Rossman fold protein [Sphingomonas alba]
MNIKRLAVYCGSAAGSDPRFADAAREMGEAIVERGLELVYGGGRLGLMGIVADTVINAGGVAYGVIPRALVDKEVAHTGLTDLYTVTTMHERKAMMTELCDAFVCLPGGIGTLDELYEAWTWNALGYHAQPFALLNTAGFWTPFVKMMEHISESGFLSKSRLDQMIVADTPNEAINLLDEAAAGATQGMVW